MDIKIIEQQYADLQYLLERFKTKITDEILYLLQENKILTAVPIQARIKSKVSLIKKINDNPQLIIENIFDLQDLFGIRIITNFSREMEKVIEIIENNFNLQRKYNTIDRYSENEFGYASIHLIIKIPDSWMSVPSLKELNFFNCEIQVRTLAQHLWANSSHILQYKDEESIPIKLRRNVNRIAALLELIDEEYERIIEKKETSSQRKLVNTDELNVDTISRILDEKLPKENKENVEEISELYKDLTFFKITTVGELVQIIDKNIEAALEADKAVVNILSKDQNAPYTYDPPRQERGVFYTLVGLMRVMLNKTYGKEWEEYRMKFMSNDETDDFSDVYNDVLTRT